MSNRFTQAPAPVKHARLLQIVQQVGNELDFSNFADDNPEANESVLALLQEAHEIVRSMQTGNGGGNTPGGQMMDVMVPE